MRLKDIFTQKWRMPKSQFQFLLVRLKGGVLCRCGFVVLLFQFLLVRLKENYFQKNNKNIPVFQFLLVRLKVFNFSCVNLVLSISIPSGAIKSIKGVAPVEPATEFQFLLVRLKGKCKKCYRFVKR